MVSTTDLVVASGAAAAEVVQVVDGRPGQRTRVPADDLPRWVGEREAPRATSPVRWVWADSGDVYAGLLGRGVRVRRAVDLRLTRAVLRRAAAVADTPYARSPATPWDDSPAADLTHPRPGTTPDDAAPMLDATLFAPPGGSSPTAPDVDACVAEHLAQLGCLDRAQDGGRLALLCHAESVGGLIAQELNQVGVPFSVETHDRLLAGLLGERPSGGARPAVLAALCEEVRAALDAPALNPDSHPDLVTSLRRVGLDVRSTRQWELQKLDHPAIPPLLAYRKLSRLHSANGWAWMDAWVRDGRFRPDWVAGAVVTGRWASRGGGALQLPKQVRGSVRADPGWRLVVADAAQLEPRVLAAMSGDDRMAAAASRGDLYSALVEQGVVETRQHAKVAMLGAMYGATSGEAGALMPRLQRAYPRAIELVESAARAGERGQRVSTWLGRTSPEPASWWRAAQSAAQEPGAGRSVEHQARQAARDWGRFTRNFVVQGTAAEWALCWMGHLRRLLEDRFGGTPGGGSRPELVYFLHDEVMVHTPQEYALDVAELVREAGRAAGELLFGAFPVQFPLDVVVVRSYDKAT
ncbi:bifunctional 3'-5' exonuclease/DNA polymerase [Ornithinimicrobium cerasi]|uniref:bifunctional 3'-5' exonuclease/DNA polymerase n=1 Tax=Ornithinimicrobium cerasi TaxID=2248773 RepID=UPI000F0103D5|nr:bifunctional 3'-5' exonuclease/DNA polymerase [Ornithinimicrobium cerasi]